MNGQPLPIGWKLVTVDQVCDVIGGGKIPDITNDSAKIESPLFCLKVSDLDGEYSDGRYITGGAKYIERTETSRQILNPNGIVFPKRGGAISTNKKRIVLIPAILDSNLMGIQVKEDATISQSYLHWWFESWDLSSIQSGSAVPQINKKDITPLAIPLPTLDEQKRIAAIIDEQMQEVEQARQAILDELEASEALSAAYLREVFESDEAQEWDRIAFGEIATITASIVDPTLPEYQPLPYISGANIESGTRRLLYVNSILDEGQTSGKYLFDEGDVLYSKLRPYLQKVALADFTGLCSADMYPIKTDPRNLNADYASWLLLSQDFTDYANGESARSRMPKLNRQSLFSYIAPVPPLSTQLEMANYLNERFEEIELIHTVLIERLKVVEAMPAAILRRAFSGGY